MKYTKNINKALLYSNVCAVLSEVFVIMEWLSLYFIASKNQHFIRVFKPDFFTFALTFSEIPNVIFLLLSIIFMLFSSMAVRASDEYYKINICLKNSEKLMRLIKSRKFCMIMFGFSAFGFCLTLFLYFIK